MAPVMPKIPGLLFLEDTKFKSSYRELDKHPSNAKKIKIESHRPSALKLDAAHKTSVQGAPERKSFVPHCKSVKYPANFKSASLLMADYANFTKNLFTGLHLPCVKPMFPENEKSTKCVCRSELLNKTIEYKRKTAAPVQHSRPHSKNASTFNKRQVVPQLPKVNMNLEMNQCIADLNLAADRFLSCYLKCRENDEAGKTSLDKLTIEFNKAKDRESLKPGIAVRFLNAKEGVPTESKARNRHEEQRSNSYRVLKNIMSKPKDFRTRFVKSDGDNVQVKKDDNSTNTKEYAEDFQATDSQCTTSFPGWYEAYARVTKGFLHHKYLNKSASTKCKINDISAMRSGAYHTEQKASYG